jgi:hypothetical protein
VVVLATASTRRFARHSARDRERHPSLSLTLLLHGITHFACGSLPSCCFDSLKFFGPKEVHEIARLPRAGAWNQETPSA